MNITDKIPVFKKVIDGVYQRKLPGRFYTKVDGKLKFDKKWRDVDWRGEHFISLQPKDIKNLLSLSNRRFINEEFISLLYVTNLLSQIVHKMKIELNTTEEKVLLFPEIFGDCPGNCSVHPESEWFPKLLIEKDEHLKEKITEDKFNELIKHSIQWCILNLDNLLPILTSDKIEVSEKEDIRKILISRIQS
jgi:hypothetical protein